MIIPAIIAKDFEELKLFHTNENNINQVIPNFPINNKIIVYQTNSPQLTYCSKKNPKSSHSLGRIRHQIFASNQGNAKRNAASGGQACNSIRS